MAIYKCSMRVISRGNGGSAVEAAAYQRRTAMFLEREELRINHTRKQSDVVRADLVGAHARPPERLWNDAEWAEAGDNGVVARELIAALPRELVEDQQWALALEFARWLASTYQIAVDVALHAPEPRGPQQERNPHMHLLMTTRIVTREGLGAKVRHLDAFTTSRAELLRIRERWAEEVNEALTRAGHQVQVTHLPEEVLEDGRIPTRHVGRRATERERAGEATAVGDYNRRAAHLNKIRGVLGPDHGRLPRTMAEVQRDMAAAQRANLDAAHLRNAAADGHVQLMPGESEALTELASATARVANALARELSALARLDREGRDRARELGRKGHGLAG